MAKPLAHDYRVALITGAASGIGRELARQLAAAGVHVAGVDCQTDGLRTLQAETENQPGRVATAVADVTDAAGLEARTRELEAELGPVDLLIASAGIGIETSAVRFRAEDMNRVLGVNLIGVSNSIAAVLPGMLERKKGHLVALSSLASFRGMPRMAGYCASKAGVNSLMESLRVEVTRRGVYTTIVCPGWIRTPMTAQIAAPLPLLMEVDYAARQILWAIQKKKKFYAFPRRLAWRLRFITWLPRSWQDRILRSMLNDTRLEKGPETI